MVRELSTVETHTRSPLLLHETDHKKWQPLVAYRQKLLPKRGVVTLQPDTFISDVRERVDDLPDNERKVVVEFATIPEKAP